MIKTQNPASIFEAQRVARERDIALTEVVPLGIEYIVHVDPPVPPVVPEWAPPKPLSLSGFKVPVENWRLLAN